MIFLRGGGAFKRHLLAPFTSKAIYYSVLATSLSTFIFHSPAYAESFSNNESSIPQIVALNVTQNPLVRSSANQLQTSNAIKTGVQVGSQFHDTSSGGSVDLTGQTQISDLTLSHQGIDIEKYNNQNQKPTKLFTTTEMKFNNLKIANLTSNGDAGFGFVDSPDKDWLNIITKFIEYGNVAHFHLFKLKGDSLTIDKIENKQHLEIEADTLNINKGITTDYGSLKIKFKEGIIDGKIGFYGVSNPSFEIANSDDRKSFAIDDLYIETTNGTIAADINNKGASRAKIFLNGGGKITGNITLEDDTQDMTIKIEKDSGSLLGASTGWYDSFFNIISDNGKIEGDITIKGGDKEVVDAYGKHYNRNSLGFYLIGDKAEMSGDIDAQNQLASLSFLSLAGNAKMTGDIKVGEKDSFNVYGSKGTNNLVSGKITNKGYLHVYGQTEQGLTIQQTIDNIGGVLIVNVNNVDWNGDKNINGIKFLRGGKDDNVGTDAHFKNINGGKIAINGWDFREDEGNGRIIIDTDGQDKREENLKNVKFGGFQHWNSSFIPPTADNPVILFGDDKIFAQGSYVQYLVLTPEEEKRICNNGNCGDVNKGTGIYDKDGRHNVAGHFIEGGAGANGESNFATLLHEGKVIKLSVGGGDTIAPVVQADGLIGELKVNDDTPGSTIGSNQINALNANMTQTFNTLKEISTKTFRTEHTNHLSSNTLKEQVAYALYNHSKNVSKNNSLDNNPINKNLSSNNLKNHTNNNLLSYNAKNNSLNDNINLLDDTGDLSNTNIASNVSNINALTNPASNTSENNTSSNVSNNTNLEAYATDEQITTYATYAQAGASDALFYDEINKGYTDLDLLRALDDIFIKQNKKESDLYTYAVPYYNYIKDKSLGLGTTKTNSYGLLAGGQLNSNYGVYGFYINLENSKRENNTTSTDTDSTSYLAGLTYYNAFHRFSNKELYVSLNTMLGTTKSDVSMIDSDSYKDDFDFDSLNYGAELRAGVNIYNVLTNSYWTPELGLIYTGMAVDSYEIKHTKLTEYYDKTTINLLEGVAGLRFHHAYNQTTRFNAALGAKFRLYDDAKSQMKIAGETLANPLFATRDIKLPDTSYYVQFGLVKLLGDNVELSLNYQGNFAKDIQGHTAFARIGYWW
ncbi:autotransporter outer membrane beta-barrel domain-containing protein [Helicobacter winghamensis]|uniref:autotransporter outer membrane beta-barrel domain-containing protein n=1 Tax=Helicobacter winghamensis TaxID=157268 RepID=UPI0027A60AF3